MSGEIERKSFSVKLKANDQGNGTVTLYAAVFNNVDRQGEVIMPGAFKNLDQFVKDGWLAINHSWGDMGMATIDTATQDAIGLLVTASWHSTPEAQDARTTVMERMARGKSVKASIGYKVAESTVETRDGEPIRVLQGLELYEVSIVNLPANPLAGVSMAKRWYDNLDKAYAALKEGRTISTSNRTKLKRCHDRLKECSMDLETMLLETDPLAEQDPGPQGGPEPGAEPGGSPKGIPDLGAGKSGQILTVVAGIPRWIDPGGQPQSQSPAKQVKEAGVDVMSVYFESMAILARHFA